LLHTDYTDKLGDRAAVRVLGIKPVDRVDTPVHIVDAVNKHVVDSHEGLFIRN